jgi:hypothetical protein
MQATITRITRRKSWHERYIEHDRDEMRRVVGFQPAGPILLGWRNLSGDADVLEPNAALTNPDFGVNDDRGTNGELR